MRSPFAPGVGGVVSADIAIPEHPRMLAFYSGMLCTGDAPLWRSDLSNSAGTPIIGLGERVPEYESLPLQWMPHIQVADVATSAAAAIEHGGTELMHGKDADGNSQWACLADPAGGAFGVIPAVGADAVAAGPTDRVGRIAWLTLTVPAGDLAAVRSFYEGVIGWTSAPAAPDGDGGFDMHRTGDIPAADIRPTPEGASALPSAWIISLPVADLARSVQHAEANGGHIVDGSVDAGRVVVRDPVGVCLGLVEED